MLILKILGKSLLMVILSGTILQMMARNTPASKTVTLVTLIAIVWMARRDIKARRVLLGQKKARRHADSPGT